MATLRTSAQTFARVRPAWFETQRRCALIARGSVAVARGVAGHGGQQRRLPARQAPLHSRHGLLLRQGAQRRHNTAVEWKQPGVHAPPHLWLVARGVQGHEQQPLAGFSPPPPYLGRTPCAIALFWRHDSPWLTVDTHATRALLRPAEEEPEEAAGEAGVQQVRPYRPAPRPVHGDQAQVVGQPLEGKAGVVAVGLRLLRAVAVLPGRLSSLQPPGGC